MKQIFVIFAILLIAQGQFYTIDGNLNIQQIDAQYADISIQPPEIAGVASFWDNRTTDGWTYYTIQTSSNFPDWYQTYSAGYMEGYLAYDLIWDTWHNNIRFTLVDDGHGNKVNYPDEVTQFINNQTKWMIGQVLANPEDNYWQLVNITLAQFYGMFAGYNAALVQNNKLHLFMSIEQFYTITYASDLSDIISKFTNGGIEHVPKCSFLLRMTNDSMFGSHTTWFFFNDLLKTYKVLDFELANPLVQTKRISYSSQPGYISSQDDYYMLDNSKFVAETSYTSNNNKVYEWIHYDSVPYWIRITVANWVYDNQSTWTEYYLRNRSGTYNNQWLVVDFEQFNNSKNDIANAENIIWMVEEFYSMESYGDVTQTLLIPQGYVASYNVPYNETIEKYCKNPTNYTDDPRAILFAKYAPNIQTIEEFQLVMRLNNHSDTGNYCQAIASRCDLQDPKAFPFGSCDCKVTSDTLIPNHQAWIQVGPTTVVDLPPFNWTNWPQYIDSAKGMPAYWDFPWVYVDPQVNFTNLIPSAESISV